MPPPSSGGLSIIEILNIIEGYDLSTMKHNSPRAIHTIAEAMKLAYSDRGTYIADAHFVTVPVSELSSKKHADQLLSKIRNHTAELVTRRAESSTHEGTNTTHLSVILFKDDRAHLALGSAGGPRIISSVAQTIINIVEFGMKLHQAIVAPRFHCQGDMIILERENSGRASNDMRKLGHGIEIRRGPDWFFGGVHAAGFDSTKKTYVGTADPRRDGIALAF